MALFAYFLVLWVDVKLVVNVVYVKPNVVDVKQVVNEVVVKPNVVVVVVKVVDVK